MNLSILEMRSSVKVCFRNTFAQLKQISCLLEDAFLFSAVIPIHDIKSKPWP